MEQKIIDVLLETKTALIEAKEKMFETLQTVQGKMKKQEIELEKLDILKVREVSTNSPQIKSLFVQIEKIASEVNQL